MCLGGIFRLQSLAEPLQILHITLRLQRTLVEKPWSRVWWGTLDKHILLKFFHFFFSHANHIYYIYSLYCALSYLTGKSQNAICPVSVIEKLKYPFFHPLFIASRLLFIFLASVYSFMPPNFTYIFRVILFTSWHY